MKTIPLNRILRIAGLLALAGLISGCKTTFRTVDSRFMAQPEEHRRVQVLPVWFEGAGNVDHTLTTNDLQALYRQAGDDVAGEIRQTLESKGYDVAGSTLVLRTNEMSICPEPEVWRQLELVRVDLFQNLPCGFSASVRDLPLTFRTNTMLGFWTYMGPKGRLEPSPFRYRVTSAFTNVLICLGATNVDAVLLVHTKAFFESKHNRTKRAVWNWTGGGLTTMVEVGFNVALIAAEGLAGRGSGSASPIWADPFWHSSNSLQHNFALVDVRTGEVLWLNRQNFKRKDPRDAGALAETMANAFLDLPPVRGGNIAITSQPMPESATP